MKKITFIISFVVLMISQGRSSFELSKIDIEENGISSVELTASDFNSTFSFFLSFTYDTTVIEYLASSFTDESIGLTSADISEPTKGRIHIAWTSEDVISGSTFSNKVILRLDFRAIGPVGSNTLLTFSDYEETGQKIEVYTLQNGSFMKDTPVTISGQVNIIARDESGGTREAGVFYFENQNTDNDLFRLDLKANELEKLSSFFISFIWDPSQIEYLNFENDGVLKENQIRITENRAIISWEADNINGRDFSETLIKSFNFRYIGDEICAATHFTFEGLQETRQDLEAWAFSSNNSFIKITPNFVNASFNVKSELDLGENMNICPDSETLLTTSSGVAGDWYRNNVLIASNVSEISINDVGIYRIEVNNQDCNESAQIAVSYYDSEVKGLVSDIVVAMGQESLAPSVSGGISYEWSTSDGISLTCTDCPDPSFTADSSGYISVSITTIDGCVFTSSVVISVNAITMLTVFNPFRNNSCTNTSDGNIELLIRGGIPPYRINWSDSGSNNLIRSGLSNGSYSYSVQDQSGQSISGMVELRAQELPQLMISTSPPTCTTPNLFEIEVTNGVMVENIIWDNADLQGFSGSEIDSGLYSFEIIDIFGCSIVDSFIASTEIMFTPLDLGSDIEICSEDELNVIRVPEEFSNSIFSWSDGEMTISTELELDISEVGTYVLSVDTEGCLLSDTVRVSFKNANLDLPDTISVLEGEEFQFNIETMGISSFEWNFPPRYNESCDDCSDPSILPSRSGTIKIIITDEDGCQSLQEVYIKIESASPIEAINFLSPNGDGYNDILAFENLENFQNPQFTLLNEWGRSLITIPNYTNNWDGLYKGSQLPDGVYYYILTFNDSEMAYTLTSDLLIIN